MMSLFKWLACWQEYFNFPSKVVLSKGIEALQARPGLSAFISHRRWILMKRCLRERLMSGCKALKLVPA
jgi:hypothetical protein